MKVKVMIPNGTVIKLHGIPAELTCDAVVEMHPSNVPLAFISSPLCSDSVSIKQIIADAQKAANRDYEDLDQIEKRIAANKSKYWEAASAAFCRFVEERSEEAFEAAKAYGEKTFMQQLFEYCEMKNAFNLDKMTAQDFADLSAEHPDQRLAVIRTRGAIAMSDDEFRDEITKDIAVIKINTRELRKAGAQLSIRPINPKLS